MEHSPIAPKIELIHDKRLETVLRSFGLGDKAEVVVTKSIEGDIQSIYITDRGVTSTFDISNNTITKFTPGSLDDHFHERSTDDEIRSVHMNALKNYLQTFQVKE